MIRILVKKTILILMVLGVLSLAACGDSYDKGQKVWISLPGASFADEGYATAKYLKRNKTKIIVKPIKVVSQSTHRTVASLKSKTTAVPAAWVMDYKEGQARYRAIQEARKLLSALKTGRSVKPEQDLKRLISIAKQYEFKELHDVARVIKLRQRYLAKSMDVKAKLDNVSSLLKGLRSLAKDNKTYAYLLSRQARVMRYKTKKGIRAIALQSLKPKMKLSSKQRLQYREFIGQALALIDQVESLLRSSGAGGMEAIEVIANMSDVMSAEEAYVNFVTNNGQRLGKIDVDKVMAYKRRQKILAIRQDLRQELKTKHGFYQVTSMSEANEKYKAIMDDADAIQKKYGIRIYAKSEKKALFLGPAKLRLKRLARDEKATYLAAMDTTLDPANQREMIETYLANYPKGKYRDQVKEALSAVKTRESKYNEQVAKRSQRVNEKLASKKVFTGKANYQDTVYPFKLRISQYNNENGSFVGKITWPNRNGAVSRVRGSFNSHDMVLRFRETKVLKKGKWSSLSHFEFDVSGKKKLSGIHSYKFLIIPEKRPASLNF